MRRGTNLQRVLAGLLLAGLLGAGAAQGGESPAAAPAAGLDALDPFAASDRDPARLAALAGLGRAYVRTAPIAWGAIEPQPPRGGPARYDWAQLDAAILVWQLADLEPVPVLVPRSSWGALAPGVTAWARRVQDELPAAEAEAALRTLPGVPPPRGDMWSQWERFVRDLVERYDGDGKADMPGLRRPVRHVQVLDRLDPGSWLGSAADTTRLLHHAALGLKAASGEVRLLGPGLDLRATGHEPAPDEREWNYRIAQFVPIGASPLARLETTRAFEIIREVLERIRLVDVVCHVGAEHHADDVSNTRFLRSWLDAHASAGKPVWLVDVPTRKLGAARTPGVVEPKEDEARLRQRWLPVARNPRHSEHEAALDWLRRGQAFDLVRGLCRARAAGAEVVLFQSPWDEPHAGHRQRATGGGQGLLAVGADDAPAAGARPTASWYALAQALALLGGRPSVEETPIGAPGRVVIFRTTDSDARPFVAVALLDARLSWAGAPGAALPLQDVLVPVPRGRYTIEDCRTGPEAARRRSVEVEDGMLALQLGPAPVYILPER